MISYIEYIKEQSDEEVMAKVEKGDPKFKVGDVVYIKSNKLFAKILKKQYDPIKGAPYSGWIYFLKCVPSRDGDSAYYYTGWEPEKNIKEAVKDGDRWRVVVEKKPKKKKEIRWFNKGELSDPVVLGEEEIHDDFITDDDFRQFLIDNDCYQEYIDNTLSQKPDFPNKFDRIKEQNIEELINLAFNWGSTPQRHSFWGKLDKKWKDHIGFEYTDDDDDDGWWNGDNDDDN